MGRYDTLNKEQKEAVFHVEGPLLILAGAGSGKTRVITHRIANMVVNHNIRPTSILAISFTKASSLEMKNRAIALSKDARMNIPVNDKENWTFLEGKSTLPADFAG